MSFFNEIATQAPPKPSQALSEQVSFSPIQAWDSTKTAVLARAPKLLRMCFQQTQLLNSQDLKSYTPKPGDKLCFSIGVPSQMHQDQITKNLLKDIRSELSTQLSNVAFELSFQLSPEAFDKSQQPSSGPAKGSQNPVKAASPLPNPAGLDPKARVKSPARSNKKKSFWLRTLNESLTFDTFVEGPSNDVAHSAAYGVACNPSDRAFNPLYIYGPSGLGKTHLLNAMGNHIVRHFPDLCVRYCDAETMLNEFISCLRRKDMNTFRARYREECDILFIDDIQILGSKERFQEEFFYTLNSFLNGGRQVAFASDRMPHMIEGLRDRIRTRMEGGFIADIKMPDLEHRMAILQNKVSEMQINVKPHIVEYIAQISKQSVRELEGNLKKVKAFTDLQGISINNLAHIKEILAPHKKQLHISVEDIQKCVAHYYDVRVQELKGSSRRKGIVHSRQMAMYLIRKFLDLPLIEIGQAFGGKDHSTVINALRKVELNKRLLQNELQEIETQIYNSFGV